MTVRLNGIQALRGIASVLVVGHHAAIILARDYEPLGNSFKIDRAGVDFFFVLSGFIITYIHWNDLGNVSKFISFWSKRIVRIYPVWMIVSLIFLLMRLIIPTPELMERNFTHVIFSFLLIPEILDPVLDVGWSLRQEILFYFIFSVAIINKRIGLIGLAIWFIAIVLFNQDNIRSNVASYWILRSFNIEFMFGIITGLIIMKGYKFYHKLIGVLGIFIFFSMSVYGAYFDPQTELLEYKCIYGMASAMIVYSAVNFDLVDKIKIPKLFIILGTTSYSIYLVHNPVLLTINYIIRPLHIYVPSQIMFFVITLIAVIAGIIFNRIVEIPVINYCRSLMNNSNRRNINAKMRSIP